VLEQLSLKKYSTRQTSFGLDAPPNWRQVYAMGQAERPTCRNCGAYLTLALLPDGKGKRTFQCIDCNGPDPLKTDKAIGWLKGELQPPK
jgi:hypothetical protein